MPAPHHQCGRLMSLQIGRDIVKLRNVVAIVHKQAALRLHPARQGHDAPVLLPLLRIHPRGDIRRHIANVGVARSFKAEMRGGGLSFLAFGAAQNSLVAAHPGPWPDSWALAFWTIRPRTRCGARIANWNPTGAP